MKADDRSGRAGKKRQLQIPFFLSFQLHAIVSGMLGSQNVCTNQEVLWLFLHNGKPALKVKNSLSFSSRGMSPDHIQLTSHFQPPQEWVYFHLQAVLSGSRRQSIQFGRIFSLELWYVLPDWVVVFENWQGSHSFILSFARDFLSGLYTSVHLVAASIFQVRAIPLVHLGFRSLKARGLIDSLFLGLSSQNVNMAHEFPLRSTSTITWLCTVLCSILVCLTGHILLLLLIRSRSHPLARHSRSSHFNWTHLNYLGFLSHNSWCGQSGWGFDHPFLLAQPIFPLLPSLMIFYPESTQTLPTSLFLHKVSWYCFSFQSLCSLSLLFSLSFHVPAIQTVQQFVNRRKITPSFLNSNWLMSVCLASSNELQIS